MTQQTSIIDQLTPEQKEELRQQFLAEEKERGSKVKEDRLAYKKLVNENIPVLFSELEGISKQLSAVKKKIFTNLESLINMKSELYGRENNKYSHSFTTDDGVSLMVGHRYNDGWDDTVTAGINKVTAYIESLGKDKNSKMLVKTVMQLLSRNQAGQLKSSRVLQLKKLADETGDPEFIDAIQIIQDAYRPVKTKEFVTARYKDRDGNTVDLALDISEADLEFKNDRYGTEAAKEA